MKRSLLSIFFLTLGVCLSAQSMSDAYRFSDTDYIGTARSLGMGNAVNALGCDLGAIGINPAGSAVAGYSQFVISPGTSISLTDTRFSLDPSSAPQAAQRAMRKVSSIPNVGLSLRMETDLLASSMTMGLVLNRVSDFNYSQSGSGVNSYSSKFAEMARAADGISNETLGSGSFYNNSDYSGLWDTAMGYNVGLINAWGDAALGQYVGCTETLAADGSRYVPGELMQRSNIFTAGSKEDVLFNLAFNFSDKFYLGANLGLQTLSYSTVEKWKEVAVNPENFPIRFDYSDGSVENTFFSDALYQYNYDANATGSYLKFGFIWLPTKSLRVGFAYQSPTALLVNETWQHSGSVAYANGDKFSGHGEEGSYSYKVFTPMHYDFGLAYTFGRKGLVSVDYSLVDYSNVFFYDDYADDNFGFVNANIKAFSGVSHNLRVGAEFNLPANLVARAGFGLLTSAEKYYEDGADKIYSSDYNDDYYLGRKYLPGKSKYIPDCRYNYSIGLGYNPAGSFFADFAVRLTTLPDGVYQPYYDYDDVYSPIFDTRNKLINAVLTVGWRF